MGAWVYCLNLNARFYLYPIQECLATIFYRKAPSFWTKWRPGRSTGVEHRLLDAFYQPNYTLPKFQTHNELQQSPTLLLARLPKRRTGRYDFPSLGLHLCAMADSGKSKKRRPRGKQAAKSHSSKKAEKTTMSDPGKSPDNVFELDRIRRLVELMKEHDLSEIDLREARHRIRICRGPKEPPRTAYPSPPPPAFAPPAAQASPPAKPVSPAGDGPHIAVVKSPMVGTFYSRPRPSDPPYVKVGSRVDTTTTVCIIEAMKVFNEIPAEVRGTVVAILVEDGEAVEFEKPLFKVDTSQ